MKGLRGKVVLIDFWTYSCINCIRTLPYLNAWNKRYAKDGLAIVGVHTPEFPFEREAGNVEEAIKTEGIDYPVVQDNENGDLERLRQPLLARRVLRRRSRPRPLRPFRRGRIRRERSGDPRAPDRSRAPAGQGTLRRPWDRRRTDRHDAGVLPRLRPGGELHQRADHPRHPRLQALSAGRKRTLLRRRMGNHRTAGDREEGRQAGAELRRQARLPGARLAREAAPGEGPARRQTDLPPPTSTMATSR